MDVDVAKESDALAACFHFVVNDMKSLHPVWEELSRTATKLGSQIKLTVGTLSAFLDALQRVADHAANAKGGSRDIGTALTRICLRHRQMENKMRSLAAALTDCLGVPIGGRADEWRARANHLDKERAKEHKRHRQHVKRAAGGTLRAKRKAGREAAAAQAAHEWAQTCATMVDADRSALRAALLEQRSQFCHLADNLRTVMDAELSLMDEHVALREVGDLLAKHTADAHVLPQSSEAVIYDVKGLEHTLHNTLRAPATPGVQCSLSAAAGSPTATTSSMGSRKSSFCSLSSADSHFLQQQLQQQHAAAQQAAGRAATTAVVASACAGPLVPVSPHHVATVPAIRCHSQLQCSPTGPTGRFSSQDSGCFATSSHDPIYAPINALPPHVAPAKSSDEESACGKRAAGGNGQADSSPMSSASPPSPSHMPSLAAGADHGSADTGEQWPAPPPSVTANLAVAAQQPTHNCASAADRHSLSAYASVSVRQQQRASIAESVAGRFARPSTLGIVGAKPPKPTPVKKLNVRECTPAQTPTPTVCTSTDPMHMVPDFYAAVHEQVHMSYANGYATPSVREGSAPPPPSQQQQQMAARSAAGGRRRPLSFVCDESDDLSRLLQASGVTVRRPPSAGASDSQSAAMVVSCASDSSTRTITADTADEDQRVATRRANSTSTFLDDYDCSMSHTGILTPAELLTPNCSVGRRGSTVSSASSASRVLPAVPQRRNSTITAASDAAPSVQTVRQRSRCTTPVAEHAATGTAACIAGLRMTYEQQYAVAAQSQSASPPAVAVPHEHMMNQIRAGVRLRSPPNADTQSNRHF